MMSLIVLVALAAFAVAEPPLSHSYLPPAPGRNPGFQQGLNSPEVIAARTFDHNGNGFAKSGSPDQARFSQSQGYDGNSANALSRNAIDANSEPANYNFEYMVNDFNEGTDFGHHEERLEERAQGEYHVVLPDGRKQTVSYEADERGFKPQISYQDTEDLSRSGGYESANPRNHGNGYDANAHNLGNGYDVARNSGNGYDAARNYGDSGNGYDATARNSDNGYDATARNSGNGYDATARNSGNGYDQTTRNLGNGYKNGGHDNQDSRSAY